MAEWLELGWAVLLQPLSLEQVDAYLAQLGPKLSVLRETLRDDAGLQELAQKPLTLSVMVMAYQDLPQSKVEQEKDVSGKERLRHLFSAYVTRMFKHRGEHTYFPHDKIEKWIVWLAKKMDRSDFLLEEMQPDWLLSKKDQNYYWLFLGGFTLIPIFVFCWLMIRFAVPVSYQGESFIAKRLIYHGFTTGPLLGFTICWTVWSMLRHKFSLQNTLIIGIFFGVTMGVALQKETDALYAAIAGVLLGSGMSLIFSRFAHWQSLDGTREFADIETVEVHILDWGKLFIGALIGFFFGALLTMLLNLTILIENAKPLTNGLFAWMQQEGQWTRIWEHFSWVLTDWIGGSLTGTLTVVFCVLLGLIGGKVKLDRDSKPNRGIWQSGKNGLRIGLLILLGVWFQLIFLNRPDAYSYSEDWLFYARAFFIVVGSAAGYFSILYFGGFSFLQHFLLRLFLWRQDALPWRIPLLLEDATDLIFLRKVGYRHIFIHRYLQDYFASLKKAQRRRK